MDVFKFTTTATKKNSNNMESLTLYRYGWAYNQEGLYPEGFI